MSLSVRLGAVAALLVAGSAEAGQLVCKEDHRHRHHGRRTARRLR